MALHISPTLKPIRYFSSIIKSGNITSASRESIKPFKDIPGPVRIPIWGNLYLYKFGKYQVSQYHKVLDELYRSYGPLVRQNLGTNTVIHVFDPDDIKTVYGNEDSMPYVSPLQETTQVYRKDQNMSPGLGNTNGDEWFRLRSAVRQMMLRPKEVHYYLPMIESIARDFVQHLEQIRGPRDEIQNVLDHVAKWALESSGMVCFETRLGAISGGAMEARCQEMINANRTIFRLSSLLKFALPIYKYIQTPKWKQIVDAENFFYRITDQYITQTLEKLESIQFQGVAEGKFNFMAYLLSRKELGRKDVEIITFSLFADGLSTTVPCVLFNLHCLATNLQVQEKAYEEIALVLGDDEPITIEVLNKLSYLKAMVKEAFRLYPNGTEVSRITRKEMVLSGYEIPSGTHINLTPSVHFRSEEHFSDAQQFRPERWLRDKSTANEVHPFILTPFGHGTRTCAGRRFAEQDLYVLLCRLIQKFQIRYPSGVTTPMEQVYHTLLFPKEPVELQFISRAK